MLETYFCFNFHLELGDDLEILWIPSQWNFKFSSQTYGGLCSLQQRLLVFFIDWPWCYEGKLAENKVPCAELSIYFSLCSWIVMEEFTGLKTWNLSTVGGRNIGNLLRALLLSSLWSQPQIYVPEGSHVGFNVHLAPLQRSYNLLKHTCSQKISMKSPDWWQLAQARQEHPGSELLAHFEMNAFFWVLNCFLFFHFKSMNCNGSNTNIKELECLWQSGFPDQKWIFSSSSNA